MLQPSIICEGTVDSKLVAYPSEHPPLPSMGAGREEPLHPIKTENSYKILKTPFKINKFQSSIIPSDKVNTTRTNIELKEQG